jgi:nuclear GTP-binding protein
VVRAERLQNPTDVISEILRRVKIEYLQRQYNLSEWTDDIDFLTQLARRSGKLLKGGEPDFFNVAVSVINDFQRVEKSPFRYFVNFFNSWLY